MRGIVYKDICLFFRCLEDKWALLSLGGLSVLFAAVGGVYAGILISLGLGLCLGWSHLFAFEKEGKVDWEKYQRVLPLSGGKIVAGKYAAVLLTMPLILAGAVTSNLLFFAVYGRFELLELGLSVVLAAAVPMASAAVILPAYYCFGLHGAQYASMVPILVLASFFHQIGDGGIGWVPVLISMAGGGYLLLGLLAAGGMFLVSLAVSAAGYCWRR